MRAWLLPLVVLALPSALAHGNEQHIDGQLLEDGERLLLGEFTAPQPGALVVVPYVDRPLGCAPPAAAEYRIALGPDAAVSFATNATTFAAFFDVPPFGEGYAGLAIDTHDATRTLILMEENAVALHALVGTVLRGTLLETRTGALGLPYPIPGTAAHDMGEFEPEGGGIVMTHDGSFLGGAACSTEEPGHLAISVELASLPDSLAHGRLVHAVAMFDPELAGFPPRPIDATTGLLQANLYLARPGEDPVRVRDALDPSLGLADALPLLGLAVGLVWVFRR